MQIAPGCQWRHLQACPLVAVGVVIRDAPNDLMVGGAPVSRDRPPAQVWGWVGVKVKTWGRGWGGGGGAGSEEGIHNNKEHIDRWKKQND